MLEISYNSGLKLKYKDFEFSIDPIRISETSALNFVTHAHKDHLNIPKKSANQVYITSSQTRDVGKEYFGDFCNETIDYNSKLKIDDLEFKFIDSGHVLGSYCLDIMTPENSVRITGDINTVDSNITKAIEPIDVDTLVIESTYGKSSYAFESKEKTYSDLINWIKSNIYKNHLPIIYAYSFGKAQEIVSVINDHFDFNIGMHRTAYNISKIYESYGISQKNVFNLVGNVRDMDVLILPPSINDRDFLLGLEYESRKMNSVASVTGQEFGQGKIFNISNHADYFGLLQYATQCKPKKVYTYHGYKNELSALLNKNGINASPLEKNTII